MKRTLLMLTLLLGAGLLGTGALAHATLVIGELSSTPPVPAPGEPFKLQLELQDPTQVPVEDAVVIAEFRPQGQPDVEPIRAEFEETETGGVYEATARLPEAGTWALRLRDQTFRQEEATANLTLNVGRPQPEDWGRFVLPPTATAPQNPWVWIAWLVGLPVVAAIVVTVLVLTRGEEKPQRA